MMCAKLVVVAFVAVFATLVSGEATVFTLDDPNNNVCIYLRSAISYEIIDGNTTLNGTFDNVTTPYGHCSNFSSSIVFTSQHTPHVLVQLSFRSNGKSWYKTELSVAVGSVRMMSSISIRQLTAPSGHLLKCSVTIPINETDGLAGKVAFDDLSLQPFGIINDAISSRVSRCNRPSKNVVPIAVGGALCLLVVIVIASYLVGRSRVGHSGYRPVDGENR